MSVATHFTFGLTPPVIINQPTTLIVTASDINNQTTTNYTGTIHFTSSINTDVLPNDYTYNSSDNASHPFLITFISPGIHIITVSDTTNSGITGSINITVYYVSTTFVTSTPTPSPFGHGVTLTATISAVSPGSGFPTGTVTFTDNLAGSITVLGTSTLNNSEIATFVALNLPVGSNQITATYNGDSNFAPSSGITTQVVYKQCTCINLTTWPNPHHIKVNEPIIFNATVIVPGTISPTGNVVFIFDDSTGSTSVTLDNAGCASVSHTFVNYGRYCVDVHYVGDSNYNQHNGHIILNIKK